MKVACGTNHTGTELHKSIRPFYQLSPLLLSFLVLLTSPFMFGYPVAVDSNGFVYT